MTELFELCIESDIKEGVGLSTHQISADEVLSIEVPFATMGDRVEAEIVKKDGKTYHARLKQIVSPSKNRVEPPCVHYQACGGCSLQHISYARSLQLKELYVKECFALLPLEEPIFYSIEPSPLLWRYRNKMDYTFSQDKQKNKFLGLRMHDQKKKVLPLAECHLAKQWFSDTLSAVQQWWEENALDAYHPLSNKGVLRSLTIREGTQSGDRLVMLTISGDPPEALTKQQLDDFVEDIKSVALPEESHCFLSIFLRLQHCAEGSPTTFFERLLFGPEVMREVLHIQPFVDQPARPITFLLNPTTFFQPNTLMAEKLYSRLLQMAEVTPQMVVYDLFSGPGTLGMCVAPYVKKVVSVELSPETAVIAKTNIHLNAIENHVVITSAVRHVLQGNVSSRLLEPPDLVTVSPPRAGLERQSLQTLLDLQPRKILYTSCNPESQVQNLQLLLAAGYRIHSIQPMDQFPQTSHVTNIALLVRM